jgi:hypothetical protein
MRTAARLLVATLLAKVALAGEVQVRTNGALVDVIATAAPVQEVLARLAQQTGMKVVYDGPAPRALVTVTLPQRTPVEAVLALFEGLGLNYALRTDKSGTRVDTLIVSTALPGGAPAARAPAPAVPVDPRRQPVRPQPLAEAERQDDPQDDDEADDQAARPQATPAPPAPVLVPIPGPGSPGSPFNSQIGPLTLPTPPPAPAAVPSPIAPAPSPTPSPAP